jgi:hypothetical protein
MTYHQTFDRLGNPVCKPLKPNHAHRFVRVASAITMATCFGLMVWWR